MGRFRRPLNIARGDPGPLVAGRVQRQCRQYRGRYSVGCILPTKIALKDTEGMRIRSERHMQVDSNCSLIKNQLSSTVCLDSLPSVFE